MKSHKKSLSQRMKSKYSWFSDDLFESAISKSIREKVKKADLKIGDLYEEAEIIQLIIFTVLIGADLNKLVELITDHLLNKDQAFYELLSYEYDRVYSLIADRCNEIILLISSKTSKIKTNNMSASRLKNLYKSIVSDVTLVYLNILDQLYK